MSLYQTVKSAITVRQVGEMYGMEPDRHGMVCCPFHSDSDPSMKLNERYFYCFGCGVTGDVIDLGHPTAQPIYLYIGGKPWFSGKMGTLSSNMAVKIGETYHNQGGRDK